MPVTDARAIYPALDVAPADGNGDTEALIRLALWCQRYSPFTRADTPDGLTLDITGCTHLFGGEEALLSDMADRLARFGLTVRLAIAPTIGTASALARYGETDRAIIAAGGIGAALSPLPVAALRLEEETIAALLKVGLKDIRHLIGKPRAPLVPRFGMMLVTRLDQALGHADERFDPLVPPPFYRAECRFAEPITLIADIEATVRHLCAELTETLYKAGKGARRIELVLFRVDGWFETLELRTSSLSRDAAHLARLMCERLDRIEARAGFGFEAATLSAFAVEKDDALQHALRTGETDETANGIAQLLDRYVNRLGESKVTRFVPRTSYLPESGAVPVSVLEADGTADWDHHRRVVQGDALYSRPALMFAEPEPIRAIAETPDNPPERFEWRRLWHRVVRADGPERFAPEWWSTAGGKTRDYYRVEDETGRRFWLYREGFYWPEGDGSPPSWFVHGFLP
jgi:protein ImuB